MDFSRKIINNNEKKEDGSRSNHKEGCVLCAPSYFGDSSRLIVNTSIPVWIVWWKCVLFLERKNWQLTPNSGTHRFTFSLRCFILINRHFMFMFTYNRNYIQCLFFYYCLLSLLLLFIWLLFFWKETCRIGLLGCLELSYQIFLFWDFWVEFS